MQCGTSERCTILRRSRRQMAVGVRLVNRGGALRGGAGKAKLQSHVKTGWTRYATAIKRPCGCGGSSGRPCYFEYDDV